MNPRRARRQVGLAGMAAAIAIVLAAASPPPPAAAQEAPPRRSVLLLVGDDHGLDLGCYGNPAVKTPHLDRLAGQGTRFDWAFAAVASCSASRSVILTGLYNHTNGQYGHAHPPSTLTTHAWVRSLPRLLNERGARTGVIGKLHVSPEEAYPFQVKHTSGPVGDRDVRAMAGLAREFFAAAEAPFFLLVGFGDPHRAARGFGNERPHPGIEEVTYDPAKVRVPPFLPDRPEVRKELAEYSQAVSRLDQGVGLVLRALEETGKERETQVIYLSDNGIPFVGAKTNLYDPGVRLPLIVRSPGQKERGLASRAMVSWVDIAPTVLGWMGASAPYELPGRSLLPVLEERDPPGWDRVFLSHTFHEITMYYPIRGVRTRRWKYLWNLQSDSEFRPASDLWASPTWQGILERGDDHVGPRRKADYLRRPREELYDLEKDPLELTNLAADPGSHGTLEELRREVREFQRRTQDPWEVHGRY